MENKLLDLSRWRGIFLRRQERLEHLKDLNAPDILIDNEITLIQEAKNTIVKITLEIQ